MDKKITLFVVLILSLNFILADCEEGQININNASAEELDEIYGVGNTTAQDIINSRPFNSLDDLLNVSGIGEFTLNKIKDQGLACVNSSSSYHENDSIPDDEENETVKEEKKFDNEEEIVIKIISSNLQNNTDKPIKLEASIIELNTPNTKDIKTENNKEKLSKKQNYLLLGLFTFTLLIVALISIKTLNKNKQTKNEFG